MTNTNSKVSCEIRLDYKGVNPLYASTIHTGTHVCIIVYSESNHGWSNFVMMTAKRWLLLYKSLLVDMISEVKVPYLYENVQQTLNTVICVRTLKLVSECNPFATL